MTVGELIKWLQQQDPTYTVKVEGCYEDRGYYAEPELVVDPSSRQVEISPAY